MIDRNPIVFLFGIISLVGSMCSFSIVYNLGYSHLFEMRTLNIIFLLIGIVFAVNFSLKTGKSGASAYRRALITGLQISLFTAFLFAAYLYLVSNTDEQLYKLLTTEPTMMLGLGPIGLSLSSFIEALFSGAIITVAYLQFQKESFFRTKVLGRFKLKKA